MLGGDEPGVLGDAARRRLLKSTGSFTMQWSFCHWADTHPPYSLAHRPENASPPTFVNLPQSVQIALGECPLSVESGHLLTVTRFIRNYWRCEGLFLRAILRSVTANVAIKITASTLPTMLPDCASSGMTTKNDATTSSK